MAALTNVRDTSELALGGKYLALPVKGAIHPSTRGRSWRLTPTATQSPARRPQTSRRRAGPRRPSRTRGGDGDAVIRVSRGTFVFENSISGKITAADVLGLCYMEDDQTVTKTGTGASVAGLVVRVDDEGVAVEMGFGLTAPAAAASK